VEIHLDLTMEDSTLEAINKLAKITGASSKTELVQDALRTLEWVVYHQTLNHKISAVDKITQTIWELENYIEELDLAKSFLEEIK
jgi:Ribbon-helix-helix protein, copG family